MYRFDKGFLEVLIVHPGGPLWKSKDIGVWSIPKGEFEPGDNILECALGEFHEELGTRISGEFLRLKPIRQKGGKLVHAFAVEGDLDTKNITSNTFQQEWPPRSGKMQAFPEVDRALWCGLETAREKLNPAQTALLDELAEKIGD